MAGLFDRDRVQQVSISMPEDEWNAMIDAGREVFHRCDVTVNGILYRDVGIRPKGSSSLALVKLSWKNGRYSFKIRFDEYVPGQTCMGLSELGLNNVLADASYMKEYLGYGAFEAMGIATPAFAYADVTVNGGPWGFYFAVEVPERSFAD
jgi:spore coat protein CotH